MDIELNLFFFNAAKSLSISENTFITNNLADGILDPANRTVKTLYSTNCFDHQSQGFSRKINFHLLKEIEKDIKTYY